MPFRRQSFVDAGRGLLWLARHERHGRVHSAATCVVFVLGTVLQVGRGEWCWLLLAMGLVWAAEALNTAVEKLADVVHPERHPGVGLAKDVAAGGVLAATICALLIGMLVFWPSMCDFAAKRNTGLLPIVGEASMGAIPAQIPGSS